MRNIRGKEIIAERGIHSASRYTNIQTLGKEALAGAQKKEQTQILDRGFVASCPTLVLSG